MFCTFEIYLINSLFAEKHNTLDRLQNTFWFERKSYYLILLFSQGFVGLQVGLYYNIQLIAAEKSLYGAYIWKIVIFLSITKMNQISEKETQFVQKPMYSRNNLNPDDKFK